MNQLSDDIKRRQVLTFFNNGLTRLNGHRLRMNNTKRIVKYVLKDKNAQTKLALLETPMGYLSFMVYYTRFLTQMAILIQSEASQENHEPCKTYDEIFFKLLNDLLWGTCNLIQFYWWSFKVSRTMGLKGLQLEIFAQLVDLLVMIIVQYKKYQAHQQKLNEASPEEKQWLQNEWRYQQRNFIRTLVHLCLIIASLSLIAFSISSAPIAPLFFIIGIVSDLLKNFMQMQKDAIKIKLLKENQSESSTIEHHKRLFRYNQLMAHHQVIFNRILLPISLYLLVTVAVPLSISFVVMKLILNEFVKKVIKNKYGTKTELEQVSQDEPTSKTPPNEIDEARDGEYLGIWP